MAPSLKQLEKVDRKDEEYWRRVSILSQTRGCGTPPPIVVHQSKVKFLKVVQIDDPPLSKVETNLLVAITKRTMNAVPDHNFTGLSTKCIIPVTNAACFEYTRKDYGTLQATND